MEIIYCIIATIPHVAEGSAHPVGVNNQRKGEWGGATLNVHLLPLPTSHLRAKYSSVLVSKRRSVTDLLGENEINCSIFTSLRRSRSPNP